MNINYQKELDKIIEKEQLNNNIPTLLLHSCCAPCSSYVLEYLSKYFKITVLYYNPNIFPEEEYIKRMNEQKKFISEINTINKVTFMEDKYDPKEFFNIARGLEHEKERGARCHKCYRLRMEEAANIACKNNFDYFTTTLSISPYKDSKVLNEIGIELGKEYNVKYLYADFKKKEGYKRSIELSKLYNLYRQDYCGCIYSKQERDTMNDNSK